MTKFKVKFKRTTFGASIERIVTQSELRHLQAAKGVVILSTVPIGY